MKAEYPGAESALPYMSCGNPKRQLNLTVPQCQPQGFTFFTGHFNIHFVNPLQVSHILVLSKGNALGQCFHIKLKDTAAQW